MIYIYSEKTGRHTERDRGTECEEERDGCEVEEGGVGDLVWRTKNVL